MGDVTHVASEAVSGYREVRIFGGQPYERDRFVKSSHYNRRQNLKMVATKVSSTQVIQFLVVIALAIPTSLIGTFLMMNWFGRTFNVISLAGMAFAVGMVVDNSIVVLENIDRHRRMGKPRRTTSNASFADDIWTGILDESTADQQDRRPP